MLQPCTCSQLPWGNVEALLPAVVTSQLLEAGFELHQGVAVEQWAQKPEMVIVRCEILDLCHE